MGAEDVGGLENHPYIQYIRYMDMNKATMAFEALSHPTRLRAIRLLVQAGPAGLPAGDIAEHLDVVQNTMSSHLKVLSTAGLAETRRQSRHVFYMASFPALSGLVQFLMEDCCGGGLPTTRSEGPMCDNEENPQ